MEQDYIAGIDVACRQTGKGRRRGDHDLRDPKGQGAHYVGCHQRPGRAADSNNSVDPPLGKELPGDSGSTRYGDICNLRTLLRAMDILKAATACSSYPGGCYVRLGVSTPAHRDVH